MPLVILTGNPCCGKSRRSEEIREFLSTAKGKEVHVISDNSFINSSGQDKNALFLSKCQLLTKVHSGFVKILLLPS